jgi:outer membrane protein assembly factor BamD
LRRFALVLATFAFALVWSTNCSAQIFPKKKKVDKSTAASNTAEPDKLLYDKAMDDIKHGRHETGRLGLQTLINTYPDSEYLAKAKLAIADSYFKQGGSSNTTQAIAGYKDFIVFFPFLPEAAYAQMQVAMANYNEMPKSDRDNSHALDAEAEFQTFLTKYPKDPLAPQAEQHLREVQESLAEGQYRIAYYYYVKGDRKAAAGRLIPLVRRYPLYSKSDTALWMLGDMFEKSERKDFAAAYYSQIVKNYPLSAKANSARDKLKSFGVPVPQPDPQAVAWMKEEQDAPRPKESVLHKPLSLVSHSGPDIRMAARSGTPQLQPDVEEEGLDVLKGGGGRATLAGGTTGGSGGGSSSGGTGVVATVPVGGTSSGTSEDTNPSSNDTATNNSTGSATPAGNTTGATAATSDAQGNSAGSTANGTPASGTSSSDTSSTSTDGTKSDNTQSASSSNKDSNGKESSSKKKGLKRLLPW